MRCEMSRTPHPLPRSSRTSRSTMRVSATPRAAVGSSSTSSWERPSSARAMASVWRCPPDSWLAGRRRSSMATPSSSSRARAATCISASESNPVCRSSRPRNRLATASRFSQRARSCHTTPRPARPPSMCTSPESGVMAPAMHSTSVVLPAPFSPTKATSSPGWTTRSTPSSTTWRPKRFVRPRTSRRGAGSVTISRARYCPAGRRSAAGLAVVDAHDGAGDALR